MNSSHPDPLLEELSSILIDCLRLTPTNADANRHLLSAIRACLALIGGSGDFSLRANEGLQGRQHSLAKHWIRTSVDDHATIQAVAADYGLSPTQFSRAFKATYGYSPQQWRLRARIEHAKMLMKERTCTLTEIALDCGFAEQSHFNHTFRKQVGMSPGAWRKRHLL